MLKKNIIETLRINAAPIGLTMEESVDDFLSDYGRPFGAISRFYAAPNNKLLAVGNSINAYRVGKLKDSVAYILKCDLEKSRWDTVWAGLTHPIYDIVFFNDSTGWMCGGFGTLLKTTDAGRSWSYVRKPSAFDPSFVSLRVVDSARIQLMDSSGAVYESHNGVKDLSGQKRSTADIPGRGCLHQIARCSRMWKLSIRLISGR